MTIFTIKSTPFQKKNFKYFMTFHTKRLKPGLKT